MKKYVAYGIGAALVDTEIKVNDRELARMKVEKGLMTLVEVARQRGRPGRSLAEQVPDVGHVGVQLACRQRVSRVRRIAIPKLKRRRIGLDPIPDHVVG